MKKMFKTVPLCLVIMAGCATTGVNQAEFSAMQERVNRIDQRNRELEAQHAHDLEANAILAGQPPQAAPPAAIAAQPPQPLANAQMPVQPMMMGNPAAMNAMAVPPCFPEDMSAYAPIDTEGRAFMGPDPDPRFGHPDTIRLVMANHSVFMAIVMNNHPVNVVAGLDLPQTVVSMHGRRCSIRGVPGAITDHTNVYLNPDSLASNNSLYLLCLQPRMARSFGRPTGMMVDAEVVGIRQVTDFLARAGQDIYIDGTQCRSLPTANPAF